MNGHVPRVALVIAISLALGACAGAPTGPLGTNEPDLETPFEEPVETFPDEEPEQTLPGEPGGTFVIDPATYDDGNGWAVEPTVVLSGTGNLLLDGSYTAQDKARICGLGPFDLYGNPDGFVFEFPLDGIHELNDIGFDADDLAPGTTTSAFRVSATIVLNSGQSAPAFVFDTVQHPGTESGTASLTEDAAGHRILDVTAQNELGHHLELYADCTPPPA